MFLLYKFKPNIQHSEYQIFAQFLTCLKSRGRSLLRAQVTCALVARASTSYAEIPSSGGCSQGSP